MSCNDTIRIAVVIGVNIAPATSKLSSTSSPTENMLVGNQRIDSEDLRAFCKVNLHMYANLIPSKTILKLPPKHFKI